MSIEKNQFNLYVTELFSQCFVPFCFETAVTLKDYYTRRPECATISTI